MARCSLFVLKVPLNPKQTNTAIKPDAVDHECWRAICLR